MVPLPVDRQCAPAMQLWTTLMGASLVLCLFPPRLWSWQVPISSDRMFQLVNLSWSWPPCSQSHSSWPLQATSSTECFKIEQKQRMITRFISTELWSKQKMLEMYFFQNEKSESTHKWKIFMCKIYKIIYFYKFKIISEFNKN